MKHLEAGLVIGLLVAVALFLASLIWAVVTMFVGPMAAAAFCALVVIAIVVAALIDWYTEKEKD
jgi:hypothetical protein